MIFYKYMWFVLGGVLHGLLIGGAIVTLYPTTYTAQAQFIPQGRSLVAQENFTRALSRDKNAVYDATIQALNLTAQPHINRRLPADNTKWADAMVHVRKYITPHIFKGARQTYLKERLEQVISIRPDNNHLNVAVTATTKSPYLSQDIANTAARAYQTHLKNSYHFTAYDPYTNAAPPPSSVHGKTKTTPIVFIPAGHVATPNAKPLFFIILFCALGGVIFGLMCAALQRHRTKDLHER